MGSEKTSSLSHSQNFDRKNAHCKPSNFYCCHYVLLSVNLDLNFDHPLLKDTNGIANLFKLIYANLPCRCN